MRTRLLTATSVIAVLTLVGCTGSGHARSADTTPPQPITTSSNPGPSPTANAVTRWSLPESAAAKAIPGIIYRAEPDHTHVQGVIKYDSSPPIGGNHSQFWADCSGTVYPVAIANENAVHMLEHGAIWITYKPGLPAAQLAGLNKLVSGVDRMALSPYPNLKTNVSVQAWGYQLFADSASDPRIARFISALRYNAEVTPEFGATCSQPSFLQHPSTFGHPLWLPFGY